MTQITVEPSAKTLEQWEEVLYQSDFNHLCEMMVEEYNEQSKVFTYTAYEVLEALIRYEGGVYASTVAWLLEEIYGLRIKD